MANIFTIGYSAFGIEQFIDELQKNLIVCVVDVRSNPVSGEYYKDYNGYNLEKILKQHNIHYRCYAREFGARQDDPAFFSDEGYVDFEKFTQSAQFKNGLAKVKAGFDKNYNCVLMCAEKDPINCHRSIMIAHALQKNGIEVLNILENGKIERQSETEQRLLNIHFPNRKQQRLFEEMPAEEVLIEQAYKKQNEKIGYRCPRKSRDTERERDFGVAKGEPHTARGGGAEEATLDWRIYEDFHNWIYAKKC